MMWRARCSPWVAIKASSDSIHSRVSSGLTSTYWVGRPPAISESRSGVVATVRYLPCSGSAISPPIVSDALDIALVESLLAINEFMVIR